MPRYAAFLRAINAGVPMKMADLRRAFEDMKFTNVRTIIASGNVCFDARETDTAKVTQKIERGLSKSFARTIPTVVLSIAELEQLVATQPFAKISATKQTSPQVTFLGKSRPALKYPYEAPEGGFTILGVFGRAACSVIDLTRAHSPDLMRLLDKEFGKDVTTRNWRTVERVLKVANS